MIDLSIITNSQSSIHRFYLVEQLTKLGRRYIRNIHVQTSQLLHRAVAVSLGYLLDETDAKKEAIVVYSA